MGWFAKLLEMLFGSGQQPRRDVAPEDAPSPRARSSEPDTRITNRPGEVSTAKPGPGQTKPSLQADDFLPIEREDLIDQADELGRPTWNTPWFGRRDLIPPADDPRTKLIDRGMVSEGILAPDELAEIHQVGADMERHRVSLAHVQHESAKAGQAAVEADRARRAALKEQKKKDAAERKRQHAEAVARRRATDIVFLGRGVSSRLHQRQSDAAKLASLGLPALHTPADVAAGLGLTAPRLRWLAFHSEVASRVHYVRFSVPKKSGGVRHLSAPHRDLAKAQRWIFQNILVKLPVESPAHGFVKARSIVTNAAVHVGRAILVNMDLENFFPSITFVRVRSVFQRLGYSGAVATIFALLCTECPRREARYEGRTYFVATGPRGLPQGACTSPALANQVARRLDRRLSGLARKLTIAYTRYADDLTFSGDAELQARVGYVMAKARHIAEDEGFAVNDKKTRVLRKSARQIVTGLVVNDKPSLSRVQLRRLRAILHRAKKEGLDRQNRTGHPRFRSWLEGKIALVRMVRPELGAKLASQFQELVKS